MGGNRHGTVDHISVAAKLADRTIVRSDNADLPRLQKSKRALEIPVVAGGTS